MNSTGTDLLRLLGSQSVPGVAPAMSAGRAASGALDFAALLSQAKAGRLASGLEVKIASNSGVTLTDDQIKRISVAADLAESQGATRALVMIDGMALKLDVAMREVTGSVNLKSMGVLTGIDSVIDVPSDTDAPDVPQSLPKLKGTSDNSTLINILARRNDPRAA